MGTEREDRPLTLDAIEEISRVRDLLERADYTEGRVKELLGVKDLAALDSKARDRPSHLRRTRGGGRLESLVRLFLLGAPVSRDAARGALEPVGLEVCERLGLVEFEGDSALGVLTLLPYQGLVIASDQLARKSTSPVSFVLGLSGSSQSLALVTIRRPVGSMLDLGTGSGIQAILGAPHSGRVVAVDRNPRAINLARFNVRLNGVANVECLEGDLFDPVAGARFDLVVVNPPFVVTPAPRFLYRDGSSGDRISERIVRGVSAMLNEGGFAQVLVNVAHVAGREWHERVAEWVDEAGCDVWALRFSTHDAATYATIWAKADEDDTTPDAYPRAFDRWMDFYDRERIEAVTFALVNLRRSSRGHCWTRLDDAPEPLGPCGEAILHGFAARDFLESVRDDRALLDARFRRNPEIRLEQSLRPTEGSWSVAEARCRRTTGFGFSGEVDLVGFQLISQCRGSLPLAEVIDQVAAANGQDRGTILPACLQVVRGLVEQGFLLPVGAAPAAGEALR